MEVMHLEDGNKGSWVSSISESHDFPNSHKKCNMILD